MTNTSHKYTMNVCQGPLLKEILLFTWPLFCSSVLQLTFTFADHVVIGRFASAQALAAVGATASITSLVVNFFMGLSIGANVLVANHYGAGRTNELSKTIHTAMAVAIAAGILLAILGVVLARPVLVLMRTPDDVIDKAVLYLRIYFWGMPFLMLYNYGSAILRALGDTRRALYYLTSAGILNVVLNLFFVIHCKMDVDGVAIATVMSHVLSAVLVWRAFGQTEEIGGLKFRKLRIDLGIFKEILKLGLPAGFQSMSFSFANLLLQSSVNSFGSLGMAGNTAALNIEMLVNAGSNSFHYAAISLSGQLYGGRQWERLRKFIRYCILLAELFVVPAAWLMLYLAPKFLLLFTTDQVVIAWGMQRLWAVFPYYCTHGFMQTYSGIMRGLGKSFAAFLIVLFTVCLFRIAWVFTVFPHYHTLTGLMLCFPVSWALTACVTSIYLLRLLKQKMNESSASTP